MQLPLLACFFLGLSKPPEQPKKLTTVLVKPEDLPPLWQKKLSNQP